MLQRLLALVAFLAVFLGSAPLFAAPGEGRYIGILPCADCPAIEQRLDLFPDGVFYLRMTYRERDARFDSIGRWSYEPAHTRLALDTQGDGPMYFRVNDADRLTALDRSGEPIDSPHPLGLYRSALLAPLEPQLELNGVFTYYADSALLRDCATGRLMPVAMEGDYLALERAWLRSGNDHTTPLPARVEARIVERVNMEGPARPTVIVQRLLDTGPNATCTPPGVLAQTEWRLTWLADADVANVTDRPAERAASLRLEPRDGRLQVSGSTGCNRIMGTAETEGQALRFMPLATTKMACMDTMAQEDAFLAALNATHSHRIDNGRLELLDAQGTPRARFSASP